MSEIRGFSGIGASGAVNSGRSAAQRMHVGQRVEGMVVSVSDEGLAAISAAGRIITAQAAKHSLSVGEHLMLEITEISGDTVLASRINSAESAILSRLGINLSDESLLLVGELLRNNQPIDADVLARLRNNSKEARLFLEQLLVFGADAEIDIDIPIKTQLIRLLAASKGGRTDGASTVAASGGGISSGAATGVEMPKIGAQPMHSVIGASNFAAASGSEISAAFATPMLSAGAQSAGVSVGELAAVEQGVGAQGAADQLPNAADSAADVGAKAASSATVANTAGQNNAAQNAAQQGVALQNNGAQNDIAQNDVQRNAAAQNEGAQSAAAQSASEVQSAGVMAVKNAAFTLLKASKGGVVASEVRDAALTLLSGFGAKQNVALVSTESALTLRNIALSNISSADIADELLALAKTVLFDKTVVSAVSALAKNDDAAGVLHEIGGERAAVLSESAIVASRQENTQIYYFPMPVRIDGEESRADIYYKKKSVRGDELNMLVALKTHNVGEVRCLVNKYLNSYVLGFAFESEEFAAIFRESLAELRRELHSLPVSDIFIRTRREVDKEFFAYADKCTDFDVRI